MRRALSIAMFALALGGLVALPSGCFSVDAARSPVLGERVVEHVTATNYGWMLFGCIPLVCGNADETSWCPLVFFRNDLKTSCAYNRLASRAAVLGCNMENVTAMGDDEVLFDAYYAPIPWVVVYKEVNVSASLVRKGGEQ